MVDVMEIIIQAVDDASQVFKSIGSTAETVASEIESSMEGVDADDLANDFKQVDHAIKGIDEHPIDEVKTSSQQAEKEVKEVGNAAEKAGKEVREMGNSAKEASSGLGFLRDAASMTVGMIGFDLVNSLVECGRAAINAQGQLEYFAGRLNMSSSEVSSFNSFLDDMQSQFQKIDMTAVGAAAEEMAVKLQLPKSSLEELTEVTAVLSSAFVKEGRTQEDAILAVSDALDGQWKRLQELGITQQDLIDNGWSGDLQDKEGLLQAMNKTLDEMGFADTAKDITNLDEAFNALSVAGGDLLAAVLVPITPALVAIMEAAIGAMNGIRSFINILTGGSAPIDQAKEASDELAGSMTLIGESVRPAAEGMQSAKDTADGLGGTLSNVSNVAKGLPDWAQLALGVTALGLAFAVTGAYIQLSLIPSLEKAALSLVEWAAETIGVEIANMTLSASFMTVAASVWAALSPLLPYIAAAAILAVVVYEVGKAFGWWTDIGSMLEAIAAGLHEMWEAFVNHPDVQATIQALGEAWNWLIGAIEGVGQAVMEFFGISTGGEFDILHALIEGIGMAWQMISFPIRTIISLVQFLIGVFQNVNSTLSDWGIGLEVVLGPIGWVIAGIKALTGALGGSGDGLGGVLSTIGEVFGTVWSTIASLVGGVLGPLTDMVTGLIDTFTRLWNGQITIGEAMGEIWSTISENIGEILNNISETVVNFALTVGEWALQAGTWFFTNLWNTFSQVPGMIYGFLTDAWNWITTVGVQWAVAGLKAAMDFMINVQVQMQQLPVKVALYLAQVLSRILSAGSQWVSSGISKASQVVQGVISQVSQLPGKVYNEFMKIATRIRDSISAAVRAATQFGSDIVNAVLGALGIASPGTVQRKTVKEFQDTISNILGLGSDAYRAGQSYGESIVDGFEGVDLNSGLATDLNSGALFDISTGQSYDVDTTQHIDGEITITHDLENVPSNLDEAQIAELINQSTSNDDFMKRIAESVSFQRYDSREKLRIKRRNGRDLGV